MDKSHETAIELQNLATKLLRSARSSAAKHGLGSAQYSALAALYDRGPLGLVELARHEKVAHPTMSRVVGGLSKMGAVRRCSDPEDRRARRVELTEMGRQLYEQVSAKRIALTETIVLQLDPDIVEQLLTAIRRVAAEL